MISNETVAKIEALFRHLQMNDSPAVQQYDPKQEFRTFCLFAIGLDWKRNCKTAYLNFPNDKIRPWHLKNWEKRKKEIPHEAFIQEFANEGVIRFGFRS